MRGWRKKMGSNRKKGANRGVMDEDSEELDDVELEAKKQKPEDGVDQRSQSVEEDELPDIQEELDPNRGLALSDFSDKYLQKLQKLSDQQVERVRLITSGAEKSTQAFKKLNKGFKQQTQQINQKVQSQLSSHL